jgi:GntR family transcriptional regulator, transcriptional repressor for pyruvate dehydrogenase complex
MTARIDNVTQLANELERAILAGKFAPGDVLPAERELSVSRGVSRSVVREALGRLASLGLVRSVHGSGTHVEAPNSRPVTLGYQRLLSRDDVRLEDLAAVRLPLETAIAAIAASRRTADHLARLRHSQDILGNPRKSLAAHVSADMDFHATLAEATGNPLFQTVLAPMQLLLMESRRRTLGRFGSDLAHRHHAQILIAVEAQDADAATAAMRVHLEANVQHLQESGRDTPNGK